MDKYNKKMKGDWDLVGQQKDKPNDPLIGDPRMRGLWTIDWDYDAHKSFGKLTKEDRNLFEYKDFYKEELNEEFLKNKRLGNLITLSKSDKLEIINNNLYVNGKLFIVINPNEPIKEIENGKLVTLFRGHLTNYWEPEDIDGYFANLNEASLKSLAAAGLMGAAALMGTSHKAQATPNKAHITSTATVSQNVKNIPFIDYIKLVENGNKVGFDKSRNLWFPHKSFEGGTDTVAYGHKLKSGEDFSNGITEQEAESLLKKDLETAKREVYKELKNVKLSQQQEEIFIDFVFNMGTLKKFPKFVKAVLTNDVDGMKEQYKRYSGGKELTGRNSAFAKRYL